MTDNELLLAISDMMDQKLKLINEKLNHLEERTKRMELTLENDISKKIDIIGEGHDFLKDNLHKTLSLETKRESMELEIINNRMEIKKIKAHLGIA